MWLDYPLRKENTSKEPGQPKWIDYTHRQELEALPYRVLVKLGEEKKLATLKVPEGFEYLWQNFAMLRQVCGSEVTLKDVRTYTEVFMPNATVTDMYALCVMSNTASIFTQRMRDEDIGWPED